MVKLITHADLVRILSDENLVLFSWEPPVEFLDEGQLAHARCEA